MESDSKDLIKNSDGLAGGKDDPKPVPKSKRSNRRRCKESTRENKKKSELPSALMPKFPSQKLLKPRKSPDKLDIKGEKEENNESEMTPMCPTDKILEDQEFEKERMEEKEEMEEAQQDDTQEPAPLEQVPLDNIPKKVDSEKTTKKGEKVATDKPVRHEKSVMRPRVREGISGRSGRSENQKKKKTVVSTEKFGSRRREGAPPKKLSVEDMNSDEGKRSVKKQKTTKRMTLRGNNPKSVPPGPPADQQAPPQNPNQFPDTKQEPSHKATGPETKFDDKPKKPPPLPPHQSPVPPPVQAPPPPPPHLPSMRKEKDIGQKSKNHSISASQKLECPPKKKKKRGFLKTVYDKTKFWARKSDCVTDPTTEMLAKSYVLPEYSDKNEWDFKPEIINYFKSNYKESDYLERVKINKRTQNDAIFQNNRPFWLTREPTDYIPKARIQLHRPLKQAYKGDPTSFMPKLSRQSQSFCDPLRDDFKKLQIIDQLIGIEGIDQVKDVEKCLRRVCANTFYATMMFEVEKLAWDAEQQQKKKEPDGKLDTKRRQPKKEKDQRSTAEEDMETAKTVHWKKEMPKLKSYNRKLRPILTNDQKRKFIETNYLFGQTRIPRKPTAPSPSSSGTSVSTSKSATNSSSAESKK